MITPNVEVLDDGSSCVVCGEICGLPARWHITVPFLGIDCKLCDSCVLPVHFVLQNLKLEGVPLDEIHQAFSKISDAANAPLGSSMVQ